MWTLRLLPIFLATVNNFVMNIFVANILHISSFIFPEWISSSEVVQSKSRIFLRFWIHQAWFFSQKFLLIFNSTSTTQIFQLLPQSPHRQASLLILCISYTYFWLFKIPCLCLFLLYQFERSLYIFRTLSFWSIVHVTNIFPFKWVFFIHVGFLKLFFSEKD